LPLVFLLFITLLAELNAQLRPWSSNTVWPTLTRGPRQAVQKRETCQSGTVSSVLAIALTLFLLSDGEAYK
jgi:hypothetical protein